MRLLNVRHNIEMKLIENEVNILVIEHPKVLTEILMDLQNQENVNEGDWILSEKDKILKISKELKVILNPFSVNVNERKIINKLHQELKNEAMDSMIEKTGFINEAIIKYLSLLTEKVPYYLEFNTELEIGDLLHVYDVKLEDNSSNLCEKLIEYLKILSRLCRYQIVVFFNLKFFLSTEEIKALYEFSLYVKLYLILIETTFEQKDDFCEKVTIFDKDRCIIKF